MVAPHNTSFSLTCNTRANSTIKAHLKKTWFIPQIIITLFVKTLILFPSVIFKNILRGFVVIHISKWRSFSNFHQVLIRKFFIDILFFLTHFTILQPREVVDYYIFHALFLSLIFKSNSCNNDNHLSNIGLNLLWWKYILVLHDLWK